MENKYIFLFFYFVVISFVSVIVCAADKVRAKKVEWRIRERTLFLLAVLGGSAAMYAVMRIIRHKTKHKRFMIGLPLIAAAQIALLYTAVRLGVL